MSAPIREELPRFLSPMLATAGVVPKDAGWAVEVKWDGMRAQLRFDGRRVCIRSRPGRDCSSEFPELDVVAEQLRGRQVVLDGELVCLDRTGKPDFAALRNRLGRRPLATARSRQHRTPATLIVFDVLHLDGWAVRALPYCERRELLGELELDRGIVCRAPRHFAGETDAVLACTAELGLEGVVVKRLDARYVPGRRTNAWLKHKHRRRERLVVTGWRERDGELPEFLLARRDPGGQLHPAGSASLGLDQTRRTTLLEAVATHALPSTRRRASPRWTAPVIEVLIDAHGPVGGPVRDAILREVYCPGPGESL